MGKDRETDVKQLDRPTAPLIFPATFPYEFLDKYSHNHKITAMSVFIWNIYKEIQENLFTNISKNWPLDDALFMDRPLDGAVRKTKFSIKTGKLMIQKLEKNKTIHNLSLGEYKQVERVERPFRNVTITTIQWRVIMTCEWAAFYGGAKTTTTRIRRRNPQRAADDNGAAINSSITPRQIFGCLCSCSCCCCCCCCCIWFIRLPSSSPLLPLPITRCHWQPAYLQAAHKTWESFVRRCRHHCPSRPSPNIYWCQFSIYWSI